MRMCARFALLSLLTIVLPACTSSVQSGLAQNNPTAAYAAAPAHPRGNGFKVGFTQYTIVLVREDSVTTTLAAGKTPQEYVHPIVRARNAGTAQRAACSRVEYQLSNFPVVPTGIFPVRYEQGYGQATLSNRGGFATADVPLQGGQAAFVLPNDLVNSVEDPIVRITVFDSDGRIVPLRFLPKGNNSGTILSIPRNREKGYENGMRHAIPLGGDTFVGIVPSGYCGGPAQPTRLS